MARQIRRYGPYFFILVVLVGITALLVPTPRHASATVVYSSPMWADTSPTARCATCMEDCDPKPQMMSWFDPPLEFPWCRLGAHNINGEVRAQASIISEPGVVADFLVGIGLFSYVSGGTQVGNGAILSFEHTVEYEELIPGDPGGNGGHEVYWRRPDGLIVTFDWDGSSYSTSNCAVLHALTTNGSGAYVLTDKYANVMLFDSAGMPDKYTDRNGNDLDFTYNSSLQITDLIDTRGGDWDFAHNVDGYLSTITSPGGDTWDLGYDTNGNLVTIDTPGTAQQTSGITVTINYDGSDRLSSVKDGRLNTAHTVTYVGSTGQIDKATIDGNDIDFTYTAGRTDATDRNGNVHRNHHAGSNITSTDMWLSGAALFTTDYTYSGHLVTSIVYPRGNRVDFTHDGSDNLTERRHRTANTSTNHVSDLVHTWTYTNNFPVTYTDPEGQQTDFTRDSAGNVTTVGFPDVTSPVSQTSVETAIVYNSSGQITKITDEEGKVVQRTYFTTGSSTGLLEKVEVDPLGLDLETTFTYDTDGNLASATNPEGDKTDFVWDALRRLTKRTAPTPLSYETKYEYDANGNLKKVEVQNKDEDGDSVTANPWITTTFTYSTLNRLLTIVEEIDASTTRTTTLAYDDNGNHVRVTKPEGNKDKWEYDLRDLVSKIIRGETAIEASTSEYAYDVNANLITVTDGRANDTSHTYDLFDRRTKTTDPLGHYSAISYSPNGRVKKISRKNVSDTELQRRDYFYDARSRLWKISDLRKDPGTTYSDAVTEIERFKTGRVKTTTNARSKDTDYVYDAAWRRTKVTDAMGNETSWTLDGTGRPTAWSLKEINGVSSVTHEYEATYDELGRRATFTEIDRTDGTNKLVTTYGHDSRGQLVWLENAKGDPTRWTFDAARRMTKKEVALTTGATIEDFTTAIVREWGFDDNDRLTSHKDDGANESTWTYDALGRATELKYPDLEKITYVYDDNGNVTKTTDAAGNVIDDVYDDNDRRTSRTVTRATGFLGTTGETFTYDGLGRMTKAEDTDYKVEFTHGVIGLASQPYEEKQSHVGGTAYMKTVKKTYDAVGNKVAELYPSGMDLDYTWSDINSLSTVTDGTNTIATYSYYGFRTKDVQFESGATATYSYTGFRGEIERIHHETSTPTTIVDLQYGYDDNHDRLYERFGGASSYGNAYEYDKARRLTTAWMGSADVTAASSSVYVKKVEYVMDDDGNRSSVKVTPYGQSQVTTSYTSNTLNQYTVVGGTSQTHDDNGNLTDDGTQQYEYDYKNQIVRVKQSSTVIAEYKYDALGRRVEKDDQSDVERYIYSGHETVSVYDGSNAWVRDFVFGASIDEVLMLEQEDLLDFDSDSNTTEKTRSFYHTNALGSVMSITDMNEVEVANYRYDPYGKATITRNSTTQSSDPLGQPWAYTGRFSDEETGLYYYRARHYSPDTGRFLQRDPLGYAPGAGLYQYVSSSPINLVDPLGLRGGARAPGEGGNPRPGDGGNSRPGLARHGQDPHEKVQDIRKVEEVTGKTKADSTQGSKMADKNNMKNAARGGTMPAEDGGLDEVPEEKAPDPKTDVKPEPERGPKGARVWKFPWATPDPVPEWAKPEPAPVRRPGRWRPSYRPGQCTGGFGGPTLPPRGLNWWDRFGNRMEGKWDRFKKRMEKGPPGGTPGVDRPGLVIPLPIGIPWPFTAPAWAPAGAGAAAGGVVQMAALHLPSPDASAPARQLMPFEPRGWCVHIRRHVLGSELAPQPSRVHPT